MAAGASHCPVRALRESVYAVCAVLLAIVLALTVSPASTIPASGEAWAATTSTLESSAATAAANRVSEDARLLHVPAAERVTTIRETLPVAAGADSARAATSNGLIGPVFAASGSFDDSIQTYADSPYITADPNGGTFHDSSAGGGAWAADGSARSVEGSKVEERFYAHFRADVGFDGAAFANAGEGVVSAWYKGTYRSATVTRDGYTFAGWEVLSGSITGGYSVPSPGASLKAKWTANTFEVTFDLDGGSLSTGAADNRATYTYDTAVALPTAATLAGYSFAGWYRPKTDASDMSDAVDSSDDLQSVAEAADADDRKVTVKAKWTYSVEYKLGDGMTRTETGFVKGIPKELLGKDDAEVPPGETAYGWSVTDGGTKSTDVTSGCEFGAEINQRPANSSGTDPTTADSATVYLYIVKEANGLEVTFKAGEVDGVDAAKGNVFVQIKKNSAVDAWADVKDANDSDSRYTAGYSKTGSNRDIPVQFRYRGHRLLGWYVEEAASGAKFTVGYEADGIEQVEESQIIEKLLDLTSTTGSNARSATFTAQWRLERYDVVIMDTVSEGSLKVDLESWKSANQELAALSRAKNAWTAEDVALNDGITFEYDAGKKCYRGSYLYRSGFALPGHSFDFEKANPNSDYVEPDFDKKVDGNAYVAGYILKNWYEVGSGGHVAVGTQSDNDIDASSDRSYTLFPELEMKSYTLEYKVPDGTYLDGKPATGDGETATMSLTLTYKQIMDASASDATPEAKAAATFPTAGNVKGYDPTGWSDASGWTDPAKAGVPGIAPAGSNRPWTMLTNDVRKAIWNDDANNYWNNEKGNAASEDVAKPLYATWASTDKVLSVTLVASQPAGAPGSDNPGGGQAPVSPDTTRTAAFWPGRGLTYSKAAGESYNDNDPATLPAAAEGSYSETAIDPDLAGKIGLAPLSREGYTFKGWGVTGDAAADEADRVYVYPDVEKDTTHGADWCASDTHTVNTDTYILYVRCTQSNEGASYTLTKTGAKLLNDWDGRYDDNNSLVSDKSAPTTDDLQWVAVWQAETYDVVLRIPMNAVKSNAVSSAPAESAEQALGDESDAGTSEPALDDKWSSTELGGTPGWYRAKLRLHYWDKVTIPKYAQIDNSYTYDGWHSRQTSSDLDAKGDYQVGVGEPGFPMGQPAKDAAGAIPSPGDGSLAWGLRYDKDGNLRATKELNDTTNHDRQMWLRYKVIQIGVDSPVAALYLCADRYEQGDVIPAGKAVGDYVEDAYNTATDGRMLLESKVRFTTAATTSHDLVVSDVVCTTDAVGADGAATPADERRLIADKIVKPTGDDERMFWLSTDDTVTPIKSDNWWTSRDTSADKRGDGADKGKRYWFGYENGQNALTHSTDEGAGKADFSEFVVARPGSSAGTYGTYVETTADGRPVERQSDGTYVARGINEQGETYTETVQLADIVRATTFRYGLDLGKAKISIDANDPVTKELLGKRDHMQGLARLTFTFKLPEALGQTGGSGTAGTADASL